MIVSIRKARPDDFPEILTLIKEFATFQKTPEKVIISIDEMLANHESFQCIIAETTENKIVGFSSYFFAWYSWSGKSLYLDDLYVIPDYQKLGIGTRLFERIIEIAKATHCKKVRWKVSKWNKNAINFYKNIGASIDNIEINCDLQLGPTKKV